MRNFLLLLLCMAATKCFTQQNLSFTTLTPLFSKSKSQEGDKINRDSDKTTSVDSIQKHYFSFFGIGNLSDETLQKINGGGKLGVAFNTNEPAKPFLPSVYYLSFNKNATNSDSILVSTLVFPETGNHSFLASAFWNLRTPTDGKSDLKKSAQAFFEFATKKIGVADTTKFGKEEKAFQTLHYTTGLRYTYGILKKKDDKDYDRDYSASIGISLFVSNTNIPDEDNEALENIINGKVVKNSFWSAGVKLGLEVNGFQIFADLRHVFGNEKKLPIKDLKGFNSNIGVAFNTEIFRL